ncbi:DUF2279 domain-containing protein [Cytophagales bacterium WSM2-2]|nr:DUF2279 domain-containing protein [Cytophagales bacterium WSM2-2]
MNFFTNKRNLAILFIVAYGISLLWLSSAWYKSYTTFHWFNDFFEWEYLDKLGHIFTSFYLGLFAFKAWGNPENLNPSLRKKWICFSGLALLLPIEILDGFSMNYGASAADIIANTLGSIYCYAHVSYKVFYATEPKFSFFPTVYSSWRPELLGSTFTQQVLKDYNGQTYWLSIDINSILGRNILPNWLMLTIGYGAQGLLGGDDNVWKTEDGKTMDYTPVFRTKQIFISIDVNATVLRSKNKMFSYLFAPFVLLKFPAPAIEINTERGIVFHLIYF